MARITFQMFRDIIGHKFDELVSGSRRLFTTSADPDKIYELYLSSYPNGTNTIYRKQLEFDCSACRNFIKRVGGLVSLKHGKIDTVWNVKVPNDRYQPVCDALDKFVREQMITGIYVTSQNLRFAGKDHDIEYDPDTKRSQTFYHFFAELPEICVCDSHTTPDTVMSDARSTYQVFKRALDALKPADIQTILDLINENNLHRGLEKKTLLVNFQREQERYLKLEDDMKKDLYAWERSVIISPNVARIRNDVIGTLLVDLANGLDLENAVKAYETKVGGENYRRPKAIYTQRQLDAAKKEIEELGYTESLQRRFAGINDISVRDLLFADRDVTVAPHGNAFDDLIGSMEKSIAINPKKFTGLPVIPMTQFRAEVIPTAKKIELFFANDLSRNMVSLITSKNPDAKSMFTWGNNVSWAYAGNMATSSLKTNVKNAGGDVEGDLRFSIQWNDEPPYRSNNSDYDAHCILPCDFNKPGEPIKISSRSNYEIFYMSKWDVYYNSGGRLDVDIQLPFEQVPDKASVENISFPDRARMKPGRYIFYVHNYCHRQSSTGFKAEIEYDGQIFSYEYNTPLKQKEVILVAAVTLDEKGNFTIEHLLNSDTKVSSKEVWGIATNQFVPVSAIMYSPNYWGVEDGNHEHGAKHTFFFLKDCVNPERPNPFFNEFLNADFRNHKRFMEALGAKAAVETVPDQLSGVGFSETQRAEVILKIDGARVIKVSI